ncbi:serine hydrolase domain-containing protein [Aspergillus saccharolyticus JOP 1030-1]|uniref:Beta-lactamase/transpeptidase-like protein n=1 Tax=Aspergillus saccharolyticus JOP 1030-1 TaxID=1450539 RepID=A0A318ZBA1_9EURO|nr:beta-lactamase/transpeptidase-like protein [Aspergillus saccharolyticus JOP 1030-1]PYH43757.1 beta-lactamase/transpeptidase-like protein [Aspergillus saccharolyticus JOP 1030-1]
MSEFDALLGKYTKQDNPQVHGVICKCVDRTGTEIYSKVAGHTSLAPDSPPLHEDAVLKLASATKLITSIALLQCVDQGLITLDQPLTTILPELDAIEILTDVVGGQCTYAPSTTPITARHLLSHTSGLGYRFTHRLLGLRAEARANQPTSLQVTERYAMPLVFEPGTGWLYGCSLDWAGVVVSRLHEGISLGDYFVEHIWKPLGLSSPFPRFNIARHPEYQARLMQGTQRTADGRLESLDRWAFDNDEDQEGGCGLAGTSKDFLAVLADLVSETPTLLARSTVAEMFTPQLEPEVDSVQIQMLLGLRSAWGTVAGPIADDAVNYGLGGLLCLGPVPEIGQPKGVLAWGGATNVVWWANRELGVAGFFATQQAPFGNPTATKLVNAWKKDFWRQYNAIELP